jgi:hypothetical protein
MFWSFGVLEFWSFGALVLWCFGALEFSSIEACIQSEITSKG